MPLRRISPSVGSYRRHSSLMKVVLPEPFSPTTASRSPTSNFIFTWRRAQVPVPGYWKLTSRNSISYLRSLRFSVVRLPWYILLGVSRNSYTGLRYSALERRTLHTASRSVKPWASPASAPTYWVTDPTPKAPPRAFNPVKR